MTNKQIIGGALLTAVLTKVVSITYDVVADKIGQAIANRQAKKADAGKKAA